MDDIYDTILKCANVIEGCIQGCMRGCVVRVGLLTFEIYHRIFHIVKNTRLFSNNHQIIQIEPSQDKWTKITTIEKKQNGNYKTEGGYSISDSMWKTAQKTMEIYDTFVTIEPVLTEYDSIRTKSDTLFMHKSTPSEYIVYSSWHNKRRCHQTVEERILYDELPISRASSLFLHIEYSHPYMNEPVTLNIPKSYYIVSNELFTPSFVLTMLEKQSNTYFYDEKYTIAIVDSSMKTLKLQSNEYISLTSDSYEKLTIV